MDLGINKQGQAAFEDFQENNTQQAFIKKANNDGEQELNAYEFYEY